MSIAVPLQRVASWVRSSTYVKDTNTRRTSNARRGMTRPNLVREFSFIMMMMMKRHWQRHDPMPRRDWLAFGSRLMWRRYTLELSVWWGLKLTLILVKVIRNSYLTRFILRFFHHCWRIPQSRLLVHYSIKILLQEYYRTVVVSFKV